MDAQPENSFPPADKSESGQKLLQFLGRRLGLPENLLHRWIRTGQIRLNGKRCKPFIRIYENDVVRLPPFALALARQAKSPQAASPLNESIPQITLIGEWDGIMAFNKPAGLATQPGTGHVDSMCQRLASAYADHAFKPAPCHRIDRDTSGVLLAGATFEAQRRCHDYFREGKIHKEYLVWVDGLWPWDCDMLARHFLRREGEPGNVKSKVVSISVPHATEALCVFRRLKVATGKTLLQARLITGRSHQIRAQVAALGYPVLGDGKYGKGGQRMFLHSLRAILPDGHEFNCLPDWGGEQSQDCMPAPIFPGASMEVLAGLPQIT